MIMVTSSGVAEVRAEGGQSRPEPPVVRVVETEHDFDAFCRREFASVASLGYVLTGNWSIAEDLAQDAFFAAYRTWESLRSYDNSAAWVRRVVANRAVSWRRKVGSEARALARLGGRREANDALAIPAGDAEVWALVRALPRRQAQVFALTYVDDLSLDQIAAVLDISPATVKTHLKRARAALGATKAEEDDDD